jgi:hypothetical protein
MRGKIENARSNVTRHEKVVKERYSIAVMSKITKLVWWREARTTSGGGNFCDWWYN